MHREKERLLQLSFVFSDVGATTLAFFLAYWIRDAGLTGWFGPLHPIRSYSWLCAVTVISLPLLLSLLRAYTANGLFEWRDPSMTTTKRVLQGILLQYALLAALAFTLKLQHFSRLLTLLFLAVSFSLLLWSRAFLWPVLQRRAQRVPLNIVIIGTSETAEQLLAVVGGRPAVQLSVLGFLTESSTGVEQIAGYPVLGVVEDVETVLSKLVVDEVLIGLPDRSLNELQPLLLTCEQLGVTARLACDFVPRGCARVYLENAKAMPLLSFTTTPNNPNLLALKRITDVLLSVILLVVTAPLFVMIPILIKLTSRGPVFFKQVRCGLKGRQFLFRKFRSMVDGADELKEDLRFLNEVKEPVFKISRDPRVTWIGHFLRRTSIDELPQLYNVLRGEMSLVGPRPPLPDEVERYKPWQRRRLSMKPGLTCLWQISGRSELGFEQWVALDLEYIDNWSPWLDFQIILRTIPAVLSTKGAS